MRNGRAVDRENPLWVTGCRAREIDWDPISGLHQGQRSCVPRQQAGHMTCTRPQAERQNSSCNAGVAPGARFRGTLRGPILGPRVQRLNSLTGNPAQSIVLILLRQFDALFAYEKSSTVSLNGMSRRSQCLLSAPCKVK